MKIRLNEEQSRILLEIAVKDLLPKELEKKMEIRENGKIDKCNPSKSE